MKVLDVGTALDEGQWGSYQKLLVFATALAIILDGLDNQLLPPAIPVLIREWHQPQAAFSWVLTSGMVGMMFGGFIGGAVGDRLGRRVALLGSVAFFGVLTILVAFSTSVTMMVVLRFLSGLGLGGAMPNAAALSSEYVPRRQRPFAVTLTIVCIPLGGSLAGIVGGLVLPTLGWRALFFIGGVVPLILAAVLFAVLPESPRYLARVKARWPELRALLQRLGHNVPADAVFADLRETTVAQATVGELLVPEFRRDTLALCGSFFFCLLSVYMGTNWVPRMLARTGFDVGTASWGLTAFNFGGVAGAILGALIIMRVGSRISMLTMAWTGGLINAVQTTMYALAAHVYPTAIRGTGVGTAVAFGRIGGVISPSLGGWALDTGGPGRYFAIIAGTMTLAFAALAAVRRHVPGTSAVQAGQPMVAAASPH